MIDLKARKKAALAAKQIKEAEELTARAYKAVGQAVKAGQTPAGAARVVEAYIAKLQKARAELATRYADLPQLETILRAFDAELDKAAWQLASLAIDQANGAGII